MEKPLIIKETNGTLSKEYMITTDKLIDNTSERRAKIYASFKSFFMDAFLPQGYPHSVSPDYLNYQLWDSIQAFSSGLMRTLSTHAVLKGMGVGDTLATPLAATFSWLIKDGAGMLSRILFAWHKGSSLDSDCKRWRIFADVMNDAAMLLELISSHLTAYFTWIICLSSIIKSLVGIAGGATRAAVSQHQARWDNMADIAAKDDSQETLVNLTSLVCSFVLLSTLSSFSVNQVYFLFLLLVAVHLGSNYQAVRALQMETLNLARLRLLVKSYSSLDSRGKSYSLSYINQREPVWPKPEAVSIDFGTNFHKLTTSGEELAYLRKLFTGCHYLLTLRKLNRFQCSIVVVFHHDSNQRTILEAGFHASLLHLALSCPHLTKNSMGQLDELNYLAQKFQTSGKNMDKVLELSRTLAAAHTTQFFEAITRYGWNVDHGIVGVGGWRASWPVL